eukprot:2014238-Rhodomonas_salina.1
MRALAARLSRSHSEGSPKISPCEYRATTPSLLAWPGDSVGELGVRRGEAESGDLPGLTDESREALR